MSNVLKIRDFNYENPTNGNDDKKQNVIGRNKTSNIISMYSFNKLRNDNMVFINASQN